MQAKRLYNLCMNYDKISNGEANDYFDIQTSGEYIDEDIQADADYLEWEYTEAIKVIEEAKYILKNEALHDFEEVHNAAELINKIEQIRILEDRDEEVSAKLIKWASRLTPPLL